MRLSTSCGGVVSNDISVGVSGSTAELETELLSDTGDRSINLRGKDVVEARISTVAAETIERKVK